MRLAALSTTTLPATDVGEYSVVAAGCQRTLYRHELIQVVTAPRIAQQVASAAMGAARDAWLGLGAVPRRSIFGGAFAAAGYAAGFGTEAAREPGPIRPGAPVTVLAPSGDATGAGDYAAISRVLDAGPGSVVYLAGGMYHVNNTITIQSSRQAIIGQGANVSAIVAAPNFAGTAVISASAAAIAPSRTGLEDVTVANIGVVGGSLQNLAGRPHSFTGNPAMNGIEIMGCQNATVQNVEFSGVNGWCIEAMPYGTFANLGLMMSGIRGTASAGGIHCRGSRASLWNGQHFLTDIQLQGIGSAADLDVLLFEDIFDVTAENLNTSISRRSAGSSLHIRGNVAGCLVSNFDIGCYPNDPSRPGQSVLLIESGDHGSPTDVHFTNGTCQQADTGLMLRGRVTNCSFTNVEFHLSYGSNAVVSGSGSGIDFSGCLFTSAGMSTTGVSYDLDWSGSATGSVSNCRFYSPIVRPGQAGVRNPVNMASPNQAVMFRNCEFGGQGSDPGTCFAVRPGVIRGCTGFNPVGGTSVAMPASAATADPLPYDAWFYITAGATGMAVEVSGGEATARIPISAGATVPIFVPASQTITPRYSDPPTWSVYGN